MRSAICSGLILLLALLPLVGSAAEDVVYVSGYEDAFSQLRHAEDPEYDGDSVESAIGQFYREGKEDPGTFPASEMWENNMDIRRSKPEKMTYSGRFFFKYSNDDITPLEKFDKDFELSLRIAEWDAFFRLSNENPYPNVKDGFALEKRRIRYRGDDFKVTLGSFGAVFGRGLAVNMFEQRTLDFDNEVEGLKVEFNAGAADVTVLWGQKHRDIGETPMPEITAARIEMPLSDEVRVGTHFAQADFTRAFYQTQYGIYGGDVTFRSGPVNLFVEGISVQRDQIEGAENEWDAEGKAGTGYYANASLAGDGFVLGAEYKDYDGIEHPFGVVPPIKRFPGFAAAAPDDEKGYGFSLNWLPFKDGSMFDFSYNQDNHHAKGVPYSEFSAIYSSSPQRKTSWIGEYWDATKDGENHNAQRLTLNHQINENWTATTFTERERIAAPFLDTYTDNIYEAELAYRSLVNIIYTYEESGSPYADETQWGLWELKWKPDETQEINLIYGSRREGQVCSGGVCRLEPGFDGIRADYLIRF